MAAVRPAIARTLQQACRQDSATAPRAATTHRRDTRRRRRKHRQAGAARRAVDTTLSAGWRKVDLTMRLSRSEKPFASQSRQRARTSRWKNGHEEACSDGSLDHGLRVDHDGIAGDDRNPGELGRRRTLMLGCLLLTAGHFCMAFDASFLIALLLLMLGTGCANANLFSPLGGAFGPAGRRLPHSKTIACCRTDMGEAIRKGCR